MTAFYHIYARGHWREIVSEQLGVLGRSGFCGRIHVSFLGAEHEVGFVEAVMRRSGLEHVIGSVSRRAEDYEFPALRLLQGACRGGLAGNVMYFHTKGVTKIGRWSWVLWRWLMNGYVLGRWEELSRSLSEGKNVAGVGWVPGPRGWEHFSGNFWVATSDYIRTLPLVDDYRSTFAQKAAGAHFAARGRHAAEFWVYSGEHSASCFGPTSPCFGDDGWWMAHPEHRYFAENCGA